MSTKSIIATLAFKFNKKGNQTSVVADNCDRSTITLLSIVVNQCAIAVHSDRYQNALILIMLLLLLSPQQRDSEILLIIIITTTSHQVQSKHIDLLKPEGIYVPKIITFLLITGDATDNGDLLNFYPKENCLFNHSVIRSLDDIITATYSYATIDRRL